MASPSSWRSRPLVLALRTSPLPPFTPNDRLPSVATPGGLGPGNRAPPGVQHAASPSVQSPHPTVDRAPLTPGGLGSPSPGARALPFEQHTSLEDDLGDFVPSGRRGPVVRVYATVTLASDAAVASQYRSYLDTKLSASSLSTSTKIFNNSHIVSYLSSKIIRASKDPEAQDEKTGATLSCVSLSDRYLPALKRLQLREAGEADEVGWEEVKVAVMTRAKYAGLPLVSKGEFVLRCRQVPSTSLSS